MQSPMIAANPLLTPAIPEMPKATSNGYTDLQEYLNWANNETDPAGGVFDPNLTNAPGGIGYVPYDDDFWTIMIPVILNSGRQQWDTPGASFVGLGFMREFEHNLQ